LGSLVSLPYEDDPVLVRRARYARLAALGLRVGYGLVALSVVAFAAGVLTGLPEAAVVVTVAGLVGACVVLPPSIIAGYAVRAADREDREAGRLARPEGRSRRRDTMP
jgi:hypothetical protein